MQEHPIVTGEAFEEIHVIHIKAWLQLAQSKLHSMHAEDVVKDVVL